MTIRPDTRGAVHGISSAPPLYKPLDPDNLVEFHAARLLLLLARAGSGSPRRVSGRTKLVKLDFFLRYPRFLEQAQQALAQRGLDNRPYRSPAAETEAPMIRYRYGPWDPRYGDFLAYLEARGLINVSGTRVDSFALTRSGGSFARRLAEIPAYAELDSRAQIVGETLGTWSGSELKDFIYELFPRQVGQLTYRQEIAP